MKPLLPALAAALLASLPSTGAACEPGPPFQLGALYWSMQIPGQVAMRQGLEDELARINAHQARDCGRTVELRAFVAGDGAEGIERQIGQMTKLVASKPDLIVVQPTDNAALAEPLLAANAAGIPVVAYDQYIAKGKLTSFLTSDNHMAGFLDGEFLAARFDDTHTVRLILVEYPHVSSTVERVNGLLDALDKAGQKYEIIGTFEAVEPVGGKASGEAILAAFPEKGSIDAVFTVNDGGGLAVVEELAAAGRDEIVVATIDGDGKSVANILAGRLTAIDAAQFCGALGRETMKVAWRVLQGQTVPRMILVPVFPITAQTHELFLGWNKPPPQSFSKPWASANPTWTWTLTERP